MEKMTDDSSPLSVEESQKKCKVLFVDGDAACGWKRLSEPQFYVAEKIFEYIDGYGEIPLSYSFQLLGTTQYAENKKGSEVMLDIYNMKTSPEAFGLYSFERLPGAELLNIGAQGWFSKGSVAFWKGNYYVRLDAQPETSKERLCALAKAVANKITTRSILPGNLHHLLTIEPEKYVPNSLKFFHQKVALNTVHYFGLENVLNLGNDTDVLVADYCDGQECYKLFLISYPNGKKAEKAFLRYWDHILKSGNKFTAKASPSLKVQTEGTISSFSAVKSATESVAVFNFKRFVGGAWGGGTVEISTKAMKKLLGRIMSESHQR